MTDDAVIAHLRSPDLSRLWSEARRRLERNGLTVTAAPLSLDDLSDGEVTAICGLLARRRPATNRVRVTPADLDRALGESATGGGLIATLELVGGPLHNRRAEREGTKQATDAIWSAAEDHPVATDADVRSWLESLRLRGRVTRIGAEDPVSLVGEVLDTLGWLLANRVKLHAEPIPLSVLAAQQLGDAHGLDTERPAGVLLADAVTILSAADDARTAWACFGVHLDRLSTSALTFMLPGFPGTLAGAAEVGSEPLRVTQRMIDRGFGLDLSAARSLWLCENPAVVAVAADQLGQACPPLVCLDGMPSSTMARLLDLIAAAGIALRVHTDFDYGGIAIASYVISRFDAIPWHMGAHDYIAAIDGPTSPLPQTIGPTEWDPLLGAEMNHQGKAVHEEAILSTLLKDLATCAG